MEKLPPTENDAALRAVAHLTRVLFEAGALDLNALIDAADSLADEGRDLPDAERERFNMMAHWIRCAALPRTPEPELRFDVIDGGKE